MGWGFCQFTKWHWSNVRQSSHRRKAQVCFSTHKKKVRFRGRNAWSFPRNSSSLELSEACKFRPSFFANIGWRLTPDNFQMKWPWETLQCQCFLVAVQKGAGSGSLEGQTCWNHDTRERGRLDRERSCMLFCRMHDENRVIGPCSHSDENDRAHEGRMYLLVAPPPWKIIPLANCQARAEGHACVKVMMKMLNSSMWWYHKHTGWYLRRDCPRGWEPPYLLSTVVPSGGSGSILQLVCHTTLLPYQGALASTANFKYSEYFYNN